MSPTKFHTHTSNRQNYSFAILNNINNNNISIPNIDKERRIKRHDRECGELHFTMYKEIEVKKKMKTGINV